MFHPFYHNHHPCVLHILRKLFFLHFHTYTFSRNDIPLILIRLYVQTKRQTVNYFVSRHKLTTTVQQLLLYFYSYFYFSYIVLKAFFIHTYNFISFSHNSCINKAEQLLHLNFFLFLGQQSYGDNCERIQKFIEKFPLVHDIYNT